MSEGLEVEELRFKVRALETELNLTQQELDQKRKMCVNLATQLKREIGRESVRIAPHSVPPISGLASGSDPIDDTLRGETAWEQLRVSFLSVLDELERTRVALRMSDEALKAERERRLKDIEKMHKKISDKENEITNYKTSFDAQLKRSVDLEDKLAQAKPVPIHRSSLISSGSSSTLPSRSFSPPPSADLHMFSRNYLQHQPQLSSMALVPSHSFSPVQTSGVPLFSPVLVSRQILPQPTSHHLLRRGSG